MKVDVAGTLLVTDGVKLAVNVNVTVLVNVMVTVGVNVRVGVSVFVMVLVFVGVFDSVGVIELVTETIFVGVRVWVTVPVVVTVEVSVGVSVWVAVPVIVTETIGVIVWVGSGLGVIVALGAGVSVGGSVRVASGVTAVVLDVSGEFPVEMTSVDTGVGTGKGLSAEVGATNIAATTTTSTNIAPRVKIVRMSQTEYVFIKTSLRNDLPYRNTSGLIFRQGSFSVANSKARPIRSSLSSV